MGINTTLSTMAWNAAGEHAFGGVLPVSELRVWLMTLALVQPGGSGLTQPKPPGTARPEGPVHEVPEVLEKRMVCGVVLDSPPVCAFQSHQENASGSTEVPPTGPPHFAVA